MTTFLLVRHALCDPVGRSIAGRAAGVHLNEPGRAQAERLAARLAAVRVDAIFSAPLERARETAAPLARQLGLEVRVVDALGEIDFGEWTGCELPALSGQPPWTRFNTLRSIARIPAGESMLEVQARALAAVEDLRAALPEGQCVIVSHGDVIRGLIAHCAGIPLDLVLRLEISPASVSVIRITEHEISVRAVNVTEQLVP
ncbi:MAG TPA: histidine phosphatase family protein [Gemmatimonadaceae bacterium]|nr:histidine phosphatase family protein [Gemmatimonadaceae bacterium]